MPEHRNHRNYYLGALARAKNKFLELVFGEFL